MQTRGFSCGGMQRGAGPLALGRCGRGQGSDQGSTLARSLNIPVPRFRPENGEMCRHGVAVVTVGGTPITSACSPGSPGQAGLSDGGRHGGATGPRNRRVTLPWSGRGCGVIQFRAFW